MNKTDNSTPAQQGRLPYLPPTVEVDEYMAEEGFASSFVETYETATETTDKEGDNVVGGYWFNDL